MASRRSATLLLAALMSAGALTSCSQSFTSPDGSDVTEKAVAASLDKVAKDWNAAIEQEVDADPQTAAIAESSECYFEVVDDTLTETVYCGPIARLGGEDRAVWDTYNVVWGTGADGGATVTSFEPADTAIKRSDNELVGADGAPDDDADDLAAPPAPTLVPNSVAVVGESLTNAIGDSSIQPVPANEVRTGGASVGLSEWAEPALVYNVQVDGDDLALAAAEDGQKLVAFTLALLVPEDDFESQAVGAVYLVAADGTKLPVTDDPYGVTSYVASVPESATDLALAVEFGGVTRSVSFADGVVSGGPEFDERLATGQSVLRFLDSQPKTLGIVTDSSGYSLNNKPRPTDVILQGLQIGYSVNLAYEMVETEFPGEPQDCEGDVCYNPTLASPYDDGLVTASSTGSAILVPEIYVESFGLPGINTITAGYDYAIDPAELVLTDADGTVYEAVATPDAQKRHTYVDGKAERSLEADFLLIPGDFYFEVPADFTTGTLTLTPSDDMRFQRMREFGFGGLTETFDFGDASLSWDLELVDSEAISDS